MTTKIVRRDQRDELAKGETLHVSQFDSFLAPNPRRLKQRCHGEGCCTLRVSVAIIIQAADSRKNDGAKCGCSTSVQAEEEK